jgi:hypothetical protein
LHEARIFLEYYEMHSKKKFDRTEFPVHPLGHLNISINFQRSKTAVYLFGLNSNTWPVVLEGGEPRQQARQSGEWRVKRAQIPTGPANAPSPEVAKYPDEKLSTRHGLRRPDSKM